MELRPSSYSWEAPALSSQTCRSFFLFGSIGVGDMVSSEADE